jgi:hypothetical protein
MTQTRADLIFGSLEADVTKANERAIRRLDRLPVAERRQLDPHWLLLRRPGRAVARRD